MEEQQYQMSSHRKLCGYVKFRAIGTGNLQLSVATTLQTTNLRQYALADQTLLYNQGGYNQGGYGFTSGSPTGDGERPLNIHGERFYPQLGCNDGSSWFQLERLVLCIRKDATVPVRGVSA